MSDDSLIVFEPKDVRATFACEDPAATFDPILAPIRKAIDEFAPTASVQTTAGRKAIASFAAKIAKSKTLLEGEGKKVADAIKLEPKRVDASRAYVKKKLDAWRDEVRKPLDDWEAREKARQERHEATVARIKDLGKLTFHDGRALSAAQLRGNLEALQAIEINEAACEEYLEAYEVAAAEAGAVLLSGITERERYEAEQEELARLRAAEAERKAKEEAEAAARAQKEREDQIREEAAAAERARLAQQAPSQEAAPPQEASPPAPAAALQTYGDTLPGPAGLAAADNSAREHRRAINTAAVQALVDRGVDEATARNVVTFIAKGEIPNITITY